MLPLALLPDSLALDRLALDGSSVTLCLRTIAASAACPGCGLPSRQVHSRYARSLRDLPLMGRQTRLELTVRRFFCRNPACPRKVFAEPLQGLAVRHAHSTSRQTDALRAIGLSLGGEAGSRLAATLAMPASPDTLLRRIKQGEANPKPAPPPRVVGVDDWAIKKGHRYGTIVVDLERRAVLDLLPGRDGGALKAWLRQHPQVGCISRDRWPAYADAAAEAAPQARQVADRWHLLKNAREALERFLERHHHTISQVFSRAQPATGACPATAPAPATNAATAQAPPAAAVPAQPIRARRQPTAKQQRRQERYEEVRRRHRQGQSLRQIAREMGLAWRVVRRYVASDRCPDWRAGEVRRSSAVGFCGRIDAWLAQGNRNVAALHRQFRAEKPELRYDTLRRLVNQRLTLLGESRQRVNAARPALPPAPSPRELSFAVLIKADERSGAQRDHLERLCAGDARLAEAVGLLEGFAAAVRKQPGASLGRWQEAVAHSGCAEMKRFAEGIKHDKAVEAALEEPWSNGQVEGQVNRLKLIKRQMFGRANLDLLRCRVLHRG
jgi:transposase